MKTLLIFTLLLVLSNCQSVPPEGVYLVLRQDLLSQIGNEISVLIADQVNTYTQTPAVTGKSNGVSYTLSSFVYNIDLSGFKYSVQGPTKLSFTWSPFTFVVQFKYHVCLEDWPNPCESGYINIYTVGGASVSLTSTADVNLEGNQVAIQVSAVTLQVGNSAIEIDVDCTNVICVIPTSDIANAVASQFQSTFQTTVQEVANKIIATYLGTINTHIPIPSTNIEWDFQSDFSSVNGNIVILTKGMFLGDNNPVQPPFNPTVVPPTTVFESPRGQLDVVYTDYAIKTVFWALNETGYFDLTITNKDLPPGTKYNLTTDDFVLLLFVPGFVYYPHMDITIQLTLAKPVSVQLITDGILIDAVASLNFSLSNATYSHPGFVADVDISAVMSYVTTNINSNQVFVNSSLSNFTGSVSLVSSSVGVVNTEGVGTLLAKFLQGYISPPNDTFAVPSGFTLSQTQATAYVNYGIISSMAAYKAPPGTVCGGNVECPLETTCCQWSSGWGCCTLPNASCCPGAGCCPQGTQCNGGYCQ